MSRSGRHDLSQLKETMLLLVANAALRGAQWLDHALEGGRAEHRECHIGGDFLPIYEVDGDTVVHVRAGTHSELFEK